MSRDIVQVALLMQPTDVRSGITQLFTNLLNIGFTVGVVVAAFFLMWGAFQYMAAGGSPRQMEGGKQAMVNALFGLAIVILARAVAGAVGQALGAAGGG